MSDLSIEGPQIDAFTAFEQQLRTLCLTEFPCGTGKWRYDYGINPRTLTSDNKTCSRFSVTLKDHPADCVKIETLDDLIKSRKSPWKLDYSWSTEAKGLREIAVQTPWKIKEKFVLRYFKTLCIRDKNVTEVDERLLQFTNLQELSLSANKIVGVNSQNLPPNLKVLELCANQISDLSGLTVQPPPLVHLGIGHNRVGVLSDYLSGHYWPSLLSLDMSHNDLNDLIDVIKKISSLPKLRNLVLHGNPLTLVAAYRGYTIDCLRDLTILDNIRISADEKHHYKGLARRKEYIVDEAKVVLSVDYISGIPCPDELLTPDEQPEYPKIERKYLVEFTFPVDTTIRVMTASCDRTRSTSPSQVASSPIPSTIVASTIQEGGPTTQRSSSPNNRRSPSPNRRSPSPNRRSPSLNQSHMAGIHQSPRTMASDDTRTKSPQVRSVSITDRPPAILGGHTSSSESDHSPKVTLTHIRTPALPWEEDILEYNWSEGYVRDDLIALRDFMKTPMIVSVIEEKVLAYPPEEDPDDQDKPSSPTGKKGKDKKDKPDKKGDKGGKDKDKKTGKGSARGKSPPPKGKGKDKKKKKGGDEELVRKPPELTTLATFELSLEPILAGEYFVEKTFQKVLVTDPAEMAERKRLLSIAPKRKDVAKDAKGKEKGKEKPKEKGGEEEQEEDLPPLEVTVKVSVVHWATATDSLVSVKDDKTSATPQ